MRYTEQLHGLHVLTDRGRIAERRVPMPMVEVIERAIIGGASVIQLREKELPDSQIIPHALEIKKQIRKRALFIINDRVEVAREIDADGVHVGQSDMQAREVRSLISGEMILGVSASTVEEAIQAEKDGATYIGAGPIYQTKSKLDAVSPISLLGLKDIKKAVSIPVIAIGGITKDNAEDVAKIADGIAVISAVLKAHDPRLATHELSMIIRSHR